MRIWSILANISHGIFTRGSSLRSIAYLRSVAVIDGDVYSNVISRPPTKITCLENVSHRYASIFLCASTTRHSCFVLRLDSSPSFLSSSSSFFFFVYSNYPPGRASIMYWLWHFCLSLLPFPKLYITETYKTTVVLFFDYPHRFVLMILLLAR